MTCERMGKDEQAEAVTIAEICVLQKMDLCWIIMMKSMIWHNASPKLLSISKCK